MAILGGVGAGSHNREEGRGEEPLGGGLCDCSHGDCTLLQIQEETFVRTGLIEEIVCLMNSAFLSGQQYHSSRVAWLT